MNDRDQLHDDVGAYLLGALTDGERDAFEAHVAGCAECREELERLRPAALALPRSVEPLVAPPRLKKALLNAVREETPPAQAAARPRRRWRFSMPRLTPVVAWGSAAFMLAVGVGAGFGLGKALSGPDTRTIAATVKSPQLSRASGTLSVPDDGREGAILHVSGLPGRPRGVYQAWARRGNEVVPQPTFEVGDSGSGAVAVPDDLRGFQEVMVTQEPRGGSRAPTGPPILTVRL
jgi:anti-sigma-K factor RskA